MRDALFKVRFIGENGWNFTKGEIYTVVDVDEDRDYILIDNFCDEVLHYKNQFEIVKEG